MKFNTPLATNDNETLWEAGPVNEKEKWYKSDWVKYIRIARCADETWDATAGDVTDDTAVDSKWTLNMWFKFEEDIEDDSSYVMMGKYSAWYLADRSLIFSNNWGPNHNKSGDTTKEHTNLVCWNKNFSLQDLKNNDGIDPFDKEWHLITITYDSTAGGCSCKHSK